MPLVHGTCVAIDGAGVLLRGPPGSGKSDLALRLIDSGAVLVADDQVVLARADGEIRADAPDALRNRLEVRGIGIIGVRTEPAPLTLLVDLVPPEQVARLPERKVELVDGVALPVLAMTPFEASAPAKLRRALTDLSAS